MNTLESPPAIPGDEIEDLTLEKDFSNWKAIGPESYFGFLFGYYISVEGDKESRVLR